MVRSSKKKTWNNSAEGQEVGCIDLWGARNPDNRVYSCASMGKRSLSRIDLVLGNDKTLPLVQSITYLTRGVSDHSPLLFELAVGFGGRQPG